MNAYIYQSALICTDCARVISKAMNRPDNGDADSHPQGPYSDGGGEADTPQHCDLCFAFLRNPLTSEGLEYVKTARHGLTSEIWRDYYLG